YGVWRQNFGQQGAGNPADLNQDGIVDIRDYGIWRANFGHTGPGAPPVSGLERPLLGGLPGPVVRLLQLAWQPAPSAAPVVSSLEADPWPTGLLAHNGPVRPWAI